ncbi:MAG: uracil-DNA glycosylase, partial [Planctomycetota bacterium]
RKRKAYQDEDYWGKPVPNFGKRSVSLLIVGLAPGAHGANRTGRMFTGDRSGDWLYRAMYRAGFCNQPTSRDCQDGLKLIDCSITAVCHCAPPDNKPTTEEVNYCRDFLGSTLQLSRPKVILALGGLAWKESIQLMIHLGRLKGPKPKFGHGVKVQLTGRQRLRWILGCYHPSQQNTFTGRLTEKMLDEQFAEVKNLIRGERD